MTLAELIARVQKNVGDPNGRVWHTDKLVDLINEAMLDVTVLAERADPTIMSETENLSITGAGGDSEIELPTDFRRIINLIRTDVTANRQVKIVPMSQIFMYRGVDIGEVAYVRHGEDPTPGLVAIGDPPFTSAVSLLGFLSLVNETAYTYTLYYAKRPVELPIERLNAVVQLPEEYHHLIIVRTAMKALAQENKPVDVYMKLWTEGVQTMMGALPRRDGQTTMTGVR